MAAGVTDLKRLSTLLEEVMDLDEASREAWIERLDGADAALAPTLQRLLAQQARGESTDPLERGPSFTFVAGSDGPPTAQFAVDERVGPYRLERQLGQGGMGEVWLAMREDGQLKRRVALKLPMLSARRNVLVQRFARERDILGSLAHPHIARLYDAGLADDNQPYLALEYVEGRPITDYCQEHALGLPVRVRLLQQVLQAVQHAHANLVIHRDLKPSNVLVTDQGQAMLLDFGIAKLLQEESSEAAETELTRVGGRAMTLHYAAPEQISGAPISIATDVWALGVLLHEVLTGQRPFAGKQRGLENAILTEEPTNPPGLPADLATIVLKALKKAPAERYATVEALSADLDRWLADEPVLAQADSAWYRAGKFVRRHKAGVATGGGVLIVVIAASVVSIWQARVAREQTRIAQTEAKTAEAVQGFMEGIFRTNSGDQADPLKARQRTAKELLDEGTARIDKALDDAPEAKLRVLKTLADMYEDMEAIDTAAKLHERRAALATRVYGPGSSIELEALSNLAYQFVILSDIPRADAILERAALINQRGRHDEDALVALYMAQGWRETHETEFAKAVEALDHAMVLLRQRPPTTRLIQASALHGINLARLHRNAEAIAVLGEAIRLVNRDPTLGATEMGNLLQALAEAQMADGQLAQAEQNYRDALAHERRIWGPDSSAVADMSLMFGTFLFAAGRGREALPLFRASFDLARRLPDKALAGTELLSNVAIGADAFVVLGQLTEAMALLDEALAAGVRQSSSSRYVALAQIRRARVLTEWGRYDDGRQELDKAHEGLALAQASQSSEADYEMRARVVLELRARHAKAAEAALRGWQLVNEQADPPGQKDVLRLMMTCQISVSQSDVDAARNECTAAQAANAREPNARHAAMTAAQLDLSLGTALLQSGQAPVALPPLRRAVDEYHRMLDPERSPAIVTARIMLGEALLATGDAGGAREQLDAAKVIVARQPRLSEFYTEPVRRLDRELSANPSRTKTPS